MENIAVEVVGNELVLRIKLDHQVTTTKNDNIMVATTNNWHKVQDGLSLNLALVKNPAKYRRA